MFYVINGTTISFCFTWISDIIYMLLVSHSSTFSLYSFDFRKMYDQFSQFNFNMQLSA
jgi:hypothetical protein